MALHPWAGQDDATRDQLAGLQADVERRADERRSRGLPVCGFCHDGARPVTDGRSLLDGVPRGPLPCPRCGLAYGGGNA